MTSSTSVMDGFYFTGAAAAFPNGHKVENKFVRQAIKIRKLTGRRWILDSSGACAKGENWKGEQNHKATKRRGSLPVYGCKLKIHTVCVYIGRRQGPGDCGDPGWCPVTDRCQMIVLGKALVRPNGRHTFQPCQ